MKIKTVYICQKCHYESIKWVGKCPDCLEWNTLVEEATIKESGAGHRGVAQMAQLKALKAPGPASNNRPCQVDEIVVSLDTPRIQTQIKEFDRVMGGGIVPQSLILIGGEPGIGKSTLMLEVIGELGRHNPELKIMYVSGEESYGQLAQRSKRLEIYDKNLYFYHEVNWYEIKKALLEFSPGVLIVDSIQTIFTPDIPSAVGTISQIKEITYELLNYTKSCSVTTFVVGHVNKEGDIAGPKILEHMVDTVLYFEGERNGHYRILRAMKNRFGNIYEIGIFEMEEAGLKSVDNPSQAFMENPLQNCYGRSLSITQEGSRGLIVEVQALVVENKYGNGRRVTQGIAPNRLAMLVAIIEKYFQIPLFHYDVYLNVVGGILLQGRDSDLAVIASILSSLRSTPIRNSCVIIGEVGLTGEVRHSTMLDQKLKEVSQLGAVTVITQGPEKVLEKHRSEKMQIESVTRADELEEILFDR